MKKDECEDVVSRFSKSSEFVRSTLASFVNDDSLPLWVHCEESSYLPENVTCRAFFTGDRHDSDPKTRAPSEVVLLCDRLTSESEVREAFTHELVHAFDHTVLKMDLGNLNDLACSELKAASLAECESTFAYVPEFLRRRIHESCAIETATRSVNSVFGSVDGVDMKELYETCSGRETGSRERTASRSAP